MKLFKQLVRNNTGYSSKSFVMLMGQLASGFLILVIGAYILIAVFTGLVIDWYGISLTITQAGSFALSVIWGKIKGEQNEKNKGIQE